MNKKLSRTCISIIKNRSGHLMMAGDRRVSEGWGFSYKCPYPKISKKNNGMLIGASGDSGLCKLIVDVFEPPRIEVSDIQIYMYYKFLPAVTKLIKQQPGYQDSDKLLRIAVDEQCFALIGLQGQAYTLNIFNPEEDVRGAGLGRIVIDDAPLPYSIGCGSATALPILMFEKKRLGYSTKEHLTSAMELAGEISPGCDKSIDYIKED